MAEATKAWEQAADIKFVHIAAEDAKCTPESKKVMFDVSPVKVGAYLARAFFPNDPRTARMLTIAEAPAFDCAEIDAQPTTAWCLSA